MSSAPARLLIRLTLALLVLWTLGYVVCVSIPSRPAAILFGDWPSVAVGFVAAAVTTLRGLTTTGRERWAWVLLGVSVALWTFGDLYWITVLSGADIPPIPSPADVGYLLFPPLAFVGLVLLLQARTAAVRKTVMVDGVIAALAVGAVSAVFVLRPVVENTTGGAAAVVTNLAYPILDVVLLGVTIGAIAMRGWRVDRTWGLLALGTLAYWIADSYYLIKTANGTYTTPNAWDTGWMAAAVLFALAAWQPVVVTPVVRRSSMREILLPLAFGSVSIAVMVTAKNDGISLAGSGLAALSMVAIMLRLIMTHRINLRMLQASRHEALTDALTGLGNRRALTTALEQEIPSATDGRPLVLVLFDLDGFKHYNDSFGHPAGDDLLARLGRNLGRVLEGRGRAYRMGGDEFCALITVGDEVAQPIVEAAAGALSEHGDGFHIGCSYGSIALPREAPDAESALRIADQRMYAAKNSGRASAGRQSADVLLRALSERDPGLGEHIADVAGFAAAVSERLGLPREETEQVSQAAELHDIGKVAIPDAILHKPTALDEHEWAFIRQHTLIGERIIDAAPALERVASMVRSTHERYDGDGYPDRLAGAQIPIGARIVSVCDAFDAMTTDRAYRAAMAPELALLELRRCAGTQFDPVVVEAFCSAWAERGARSRVSR